MARKGQTFSLYQQLAHIVERCTRFSLWLSPATTFPIKFLSLRSLDFSRLPCSPQIPPCSPQQGTRTQQTSASIPGPVPWGCPCRENHAGSSVEPGALHFLWQKVEPTVPNKQFMRLFFSHSSVSWLLLWQDSICMHDKRKISRIFFISKALLFSNLAHTLFTSLLPVVISTSLWLAGRNSHFYSLTTKTGHHSILGKYL